MSRKAAQTGPGAMALVAMEQSLPENKRIVNDDLALRILPLGYRVEVKLMKPITKWIIKKSEQKVPGLWGSIMSRKRYIDDRVSEYADGRIDAIVNLGAGFDTRSLRLPALAQVQPAPQHLNLVEIDFDHQDLGTVLTSNGYSPEMKTFFIWEGVTQYVTESGIRATFQFLARAAPGSRLVFTYTPKDFIDGGNFYGQEYLYKQMLVRDQIWLFGIDPVEVEGFIGEYGWRVVEHLGYDDLVERYVAPTGRNLQSMDIERVVLAEKG